MLEDGVNVTGTTSPRLEQVLSIPPGGRRRTRKQSEYGVRLRAKQLKARSRTVYYLLKWALLGGLIYLVFV